MTRLLHWLNAVLLIAVICLSFGVWKQSQERNRWEDNVSVAVSQLAELRNTHEKMRQDAKANDPSTVAASNATTPPAGEPAADTDNAVRSKLKRLEEEQTRREERLNALNGYDTGFVALKIPPHTVCYRQRDNSSRIGTL